MMNTNPFEELQVVVLERDLPEQGLRRGHVGTIVMVYPPDAFEVEFMTASGNTVALLTLRTPDLRQARCTDMMTVRQRERTEHDADVI